ncbi:CHAT domain-containing protein [Acaryochloris sp. CCMEE 5410]|uniref:CHAT domain-containing protein n=1 Tax=Acaryochloris sp. CCMEE 5410 TaxID=310037 RepID=UPI0021CE9E31|nr:CHAT domain-containing protein [Acaryochloris sp. CCMEE 5410]KAI9129046.1 CHAT domain-containing protein [Acaryochloris sp. CCMEE 5410]
MGKTILLELRAKGEGLKDGCSVTLQLQEDGKPGYSRIPGSLPPAPELEAAYIAWKCAYHALDNQLRGKGVATITISNREIQGLGCTLGDCLNQWLNSGEVGFQPVRDKLIAALNQNNGETRIVVQSDMDAIYKMPWHLWTLLDECPRAEVSVSPLTSEKSHTKVQVRDKVRILAVIGNKNGINLKKDKSILKQVSSKEAEILFLLQKPQRYFYQALREEKGWDILFFAGHSWTEGNQGVLHINQNDKLTISDLKYAMRSAIEKGLRLAIFNSCDGLGLAWDLAKLHIPHVIVMREPVPDKLAYEFFNHFFKAFVGIDCEEQSLYLAVRSARDKLHDFEREFPCASWLPIICHNPSEVSLTWNNLRQPVTQTNQSSYEYIAKDINDFYMYYANQISQAKKEIWLTSDGFNMQNLSSFHYAEIIKNSMKIALNNGVKVYRFQILKTMHLNWIRELKKIKDLYEDNYIIYANPRFDEIENFCVIDPGTIHTITETMFSKIQPTAQYSTAEVATFIHGNQSWSNRILRRIQTVINQKDTQMYSASELSHLYNQLFLERKQKLLEWKQKNPNRTDEECSHGSGVFDSEIFGNLQRGQEL